MDELKKLINICSAFKRDEFSVEEFQERLETVYLPDECKNTLEKVQHNSCNKLEEIIYSYVESRKKYAYAVADDLIQSASLEQKRLHSEKNK